MKTAKEFLTCGKVKEECEGCEVSFLCNCVHCIVRPWSGKPDGYCCEWLSDYDPKLFDECLKLFEKGA